MTLIEDNHSKVASQTVENMLLPGNTEVVELKMSHLIFYWTDLDSILNELAKIVHFDLSTWIGHFYQREVDFWMKFCEDK